MSPVVESPHRQGARISPAQGPEASLRAVPSVEELERLGVYDPAAPDAHDVLRIVERVFELGATREEVVEAAKIHGLGPLAMDLMIRPPGQLAAVAEAAPQAGPDT